MQRLLEKLSMELAAFVEQRDVGLLVVRGKATDAAHALPLIQALQDERPYDAFWTFTEDFSSASDFVERVVRAFVSRHTAINEVLRSRGLEPWSEMPPSIRGERLPPVERLRALMAFARSELSDEEACSIWTFFPHHIARPQEWPTFIATLMAFERMSPWCYRLRCIVRDEPGTEHAWSRSGGPPARGLDVDFGSAAIEQALEADVNDAAVPEAQRLQALLMTAAMDLAQQRYSAASGKYQLLAHYHLSRGEHLPAAMSLNGLVEVYSRTGEHDRAERLFGAALEPALEAGAVPVLLNISLNLGELAFRRERWEEAGMCFEGVARMALMQDMLEAAASAMERMGRCREQLRRRDSAVEAWERGAMFARKAGASEVLHLLLKHLERHYRRVGEREKLCAIERELEESHGSH